MKKIISTSLCVIILVTMCTFNMNASSNMVCGNERESYVTLASSDLEQTDGEFDFPAPTPTPTPICTMPYIDYYGKIQRWDGGYEIIFTIRPVRTGLYGWRIYLKKNEVNIQSSWGVEVKEEDNYLILTPLSYNYYVYDGESIQVGIKGSGTINDDYFMSVSR